MLESLSRRISLGIVVPAGEVFAPEGLRVAGVVRGSMAEAAGVVAGDVVVAVGGSPVRSSEELREATRRAGGRREIAVTVLRDGRRLEGRAPVVHGAVEVIDGSVVSHEQVVAADGARLRTIVTRPAGGQVAREEEQEREREQEKGGARRRPAVLFVQGIDRESLDFGARVGAPVRELVHGWARAGFVTMRVEKRGVGDSDGDEGGFDVELSDARAALRALAADAAVDPRAIFVFGHSVGGMIAPLLCEEPGAGGEPLVRGVVVLGTSARGWLEVVAASTRRQLALAGWSAEAIEEGVSREREEGFGVRTPAYHAELAARDVGAAWDRVACDVLVIAGEHDVVVGDDEQAEIAERVSGRRPGAARLVRIAGLDHWMTRHASLAACLAAPGRGGFAEEVVGATVTWMGERIEAGGRAGT